jgi:hypothetical protein
MVGIPKPFWTDPHTLSNFSCLQQAWNNVNSDINGRPQVDYTGYVAGQPILSFPQTGQDLVCCGLSICPSSCSHLPGGNFWGPRYTKIRKPRGNSVSYKLATGRMMNGLPSEWFSIMVLPLGQKMDPGVWRPGMNPGLGCNGVFTASSTIFFPVPGSHISLRNTTCCVARGVPHLNLYAQLHYLATSCHWDYN